MRAHACSFMTALGYSQAVVSSSQLSCQLTAILSLLQTAPLSLRDEAFGNLCHSQAEEGGGGGKGTSGNTWHASSTVHD